MLQVLAQVADFFIKAAVAYIGTPEGEKEAQDILDAAEGTFFDVTPGSDEPLQVEEVKAAAQRVKRVIRGAGR